MDLDRISAVVRPRGRWEAVDLGFIMARAWWGPLYRAWLAVTLPAFLLFNLVFYNEPWLAALSMWWLKPIWERGLLHILSLAFFGEIPTLRQTLKAFWPLARRQWFASLTYRRFSFSRSMDLPVIQLENLKGEQRSQRLSVLHGTANTGASWLTFVGIHVESMMPFALLGLAYMFVPAEVELDWGAIFTGDELLLQLFSNLLGYCVMGVVAPFYVAAGFSLYLHRRIWLEGWDIEIAFRRLMGRLNSVPSSPGRGTASSLLVALLCLVLLWPDGGMAAEQELAPRDQAKADIEKILEGEAFHDVETSRFPKFLSDDEEKKKESSPLPEWLLALVTWLAVNMRILLWALAIALVLILLFRYRGWLSRYAVPQRLGREEETPPSVLFGLQVRGDALPDDILAEVESLRNRQALREALSLLYRAALSRLMEQHNVRFRRGDTEGECVARAADRVSAELGGFFADLTRQWQSLAYAHRLPDSDTFDNLCRQWRQFFQTQRGGPVGGADE